MAARISLLCNDAALEETDGLWTVRGDPTEGALLVLGRKAGLDPEAIRPEFPRVAEIPFSSETKRMSTFHEEPGGVLMCVKGAPESLLHRAARVLTARRGEAASPVMTGGRSWPRGLKWPMRPSGSWVWPTGG